MKALTTLAVLAVIALAVLNLAWDFSPKADAEYPMCNQHIEWQYAGK